MLMGPKGLIIQQNNNFDNDFSLETVTKGIFLFRSSIIVGFACLKSILECQLKRYEIINFAKYQNYVKHINELKK